MDSNPFNKLPTVEHTKAEDLIEFTATPYFSMAEKLEAVRLYRIDESGPATYRAVLDANMYLWRMAANKVPTQYWQSATEADVALLKRIADYMVNAGIQMKEKYVEATLVHMINLNVSMFKNILSGLNALEEDRKKNNASSPTVEASLHQVLADEFARAANC